AGDSCIARFRSGQCPLRGKKLTQRHHGAMSALPPKADKEQTCRNVRFVPKADICSAAKSINDVSAPALLCGPIGGGQSAELLESRGRDGLSDRVIEASYSASRSFLTTSS